MDERGRVDKQPFDFVRCPSCLSARNKYNDTSEKKIISPPVTTPFGVTEGVVRGGNVSPITNGVSLVDHRSGIVAWRCLPTETRTDKRCVVRVSPEAIIHPEHGWVCDFCGVWTFGDDTHHTPVKGGKR